MTSFATRNAAGICDTVRCVAIDSEIGPRTCIARITLRPLTRNGSVYGLGFVQRGVPSRAVVTLAFLTRRDFPCLSYIAIAYLGPTIFPAPPSICLLYLYFFFIVKVLTLFCFYVSYNSVHTKANYKKYVSFHHIELKEVVVNFSKFANREFLI